MRVGQIGYFLRGSMADPGEEARPFMIEVECQPSEWPLISCTMPTRGHVFPARHAIHCFLRQSYPNRELVVVCVTKDSEVERYVATLNDPRIRFHHVPEATNVGDMRNAAIAKSEGSLISIWDDDDLSHPERLALQYNVLLRSEAKACFLTRTLLWWPAASRLAVSPPRTWEPTMLVERAVLPAYQSLVRGSDSLLVENLRKSGRVAVADHPASYCYILHGSNLWGADHFVEFFAQATGGFDESEYRKAIDELSAHMPMHDYALEIFQQREGR
jgi:glycosyltransferase involved in cell wall biosynthesis